MVFLKKTAFGTGVISNTSMTKFNIKRISDKKYSLKIIYILAKKIRLDIPDSSEIALLEYILRQYTSVTINVILENITISFIHYFLYPEVRIAEITPLVSSFNMCVWDDKTCC